MQKTRRVNLDAEFLGLERTLEDDILDIMDGFVRESATNVIDNIIKDISSDKDIKDLDNHIRNIIYDVLREVFGDTFTINGNNGNLFKKQLFFMLESNGFVRDCPTCYFNTQRLGKIKHNDR